MRSGTLSRTNSNVTVYVNKIMLYIHCRRTEETQIHALDDFFFEENRNENKKMSTNFAENEHRPQIFCETHQMVINVFIILCGHRLDKMGMSLNI